MMTAKRRLLRRNRAINADPDAGGGYEPEAAALFARFTTPPDAARKTLINNFWKTPGIKAIMAKLDAFYVMAAADSQAARQNWITDQFNLAAVSAPSFLTDRGYIGDGSSAYLRGGALASLVKYQQNDASIFVWSLTDLEAINSPDAGTDGASFDLFLTGRFPTNLMRTRLNAASNADTAVTDSLGFYGQTRLSSSEYNAVKGATFSLKTADSTAVTLGNFSLFRNNTQFSARRLAFASIGGGLSQAEATALRTNLNIYLIAVGAA